MLVWYFVLFCFCFFFVEIWLEAMCLAEEGQLLPASILYSVGLLVGWDLRQIVPLSSFYRTEIMAAYIDRDKASVELRATHVNCESLILCLVFML
jgi:hypothetical protein